VRKISLALALALMLPISARAFSTQDILSLVSMPLAVAAVSDLAGVPQSPLANVLTDLNQANVPPTQFVQVVRYVPVALVQQPQPFVQFVDTQVSNGLTGPSLVMAIDQNLTTNYGFTPVIEPNSVVYVDESYVPQTVLSRLGGSNPLAVALMPLAVAAVSDLAGVPQDQLESLVSTLNQANVPPTQFVEVVQYAPVALTTQNAQPFVPWVQTQFAQGITGPALVTVIDQQLPQYGVTPQYVPPTLALLPRPQRAVISPTTVVPTVMPTEVRPQFTEHNPHGGPPGQIKKIEGLQTGAEVVHGAKPGRQFIAGEEHHGNPHGIPPGHAKRMNFPPMASSGPPMPVAVPQIQPPPPQPQHGPPGGIPPGQAKKEGGDEHGGGHGNDNGHGKGHGKD